MKVKTRNLIAAISATALLGSAIGVGTYALSNSTNNDFGFKGTYSLNALAEETAEAKKVTFARVSIDTTTTLTLQSTDTTYTLFVTVIDNGDMTSLSDMQVGYTIGSKNYNGTGTGLSNVVYSSLTVKTDGENTDTVTAEELVEGNSAYTDFSSPMLVIAEVETETVGSNSATLVIAESPDFDIDAWTKSDVNYRGLESGKAHDFNSFSISPAGGYAKTTPYTPDGEDPTVVTSDDGSSFVVGYVAGGTTNATQNYCVITANYDINITVYYTCTDSAFNSKDQSKKGNLTWVFGAADESGEIVFGTDVNSSSNTDNKYYKTAYFETISISEGQSVKLYMSANRLCLFGITATMK